MSRPANITLGNYTFSLRMYDFPQPPRQITPAKARDGREFIPKHPAIFTSNLWVLEEKLDGERLLAHFEEVVRFTTRRVSKQTGLMNEKTNNVPHLRDVASLVPQFAGSVIDGEVIMRTAVDTVEGDGTLTSTASIMNSKPDRAIEIQQRNGWIEYFVFDCLFYKGEDIRNKPNDVRRTYAEKICTAINEAVGFELYHLVPQFKSTDPEAKKKFHQDILDRGGEGTICKQINCKYGETNAWVKNKRETTFDVFVTGFEYGKVGGKYENQVGAILCSTYDGDTVVEVCKVVPGDDEFRRKITSDFDSIRGKVIEIAGQEATQKNNRVRHPRILRWRPDKSPEQCLYSQFTDDGE